MLDFIISEELKLLKNSFSFLSNSDKLSNYFGFFYFAAIRFLEAVNRFYFSVRRFLDAVDRFFSAVGLFYFSVRYFQLTVRRFFEASHRF